MLIHRPSRWRATSERREATSIRTRLRAGTSSILGLNGISGRAGFMRNGPFSFSMNAKQQAGVVLLVAAVAAGVWSYNRYSSLVGQLHSWSPPLDQFEVYTIIGGLVALLFLVSGLRMVSGKKAEKSGS